MCTVQIQLETRKHDTHNCWQSPHQRNMGEEAEDGGVSRCLSIKLRTWGTVESRGIITGMSTKPMRRRNRSCNTCQSDVMFIRCRRLRGRLYHDDNMCSVTIYTGLAMLWSSKLAKKKTLIILFSKRHKGGSSAPVQFFCIKPEICSYETPMDSRKNRSTIQFSENPVKTRFP